MSEQVIDRLARHAAEAPEREIAREWSASGAGRSLTRAGLLERAGALALRLREAGAEGGVTLIAGATGLEFMIAAVGAWLADAEALLAPSTLTPAELRQLVAQARPGVAVASREVGQALAGAVPHVIDAGELLGAPAPGVGERALARCAGRGGALLQSSGTTGMPRIVRRGMPGLAAVAHNCAEALALQADDNVLLTLPQHHSYGLEHGLLMVLFAGCRVELHREFDPAAVADALVSGRATLFPGVPFMFEVMGRLGRAPRVVPVSCRAYSAGTGLPEAVACEVEAVLGLRLGQVYGATEFGSVTYNNPRDADYAPASAGRPMGGVRLRIVDPDQTVIEAALPPDRQGQVAVASPSMLDAYLGASEPATREGFFLSGDLGRLDAGGRLWVTGRLSFIIDVGGAKVNPLEIEAVIAQHPAVAEAVVVPLPVTATVCRLKAFVQPRAGARLDVAELRQFLRARLSGHKLPRIIEARETLPRSPTGKVLRQRLWT